MINRRGSSGERREQFLRSIPISSLEKQLSYMTKQMEWYKVRNIAHESNNRLVITLQDASDYDSVVRRCEYAEEGRQINPGWRVKVYEGDGLNANVLRRLKLIFIALAVGSRNQALAA